MEMETVLTIWEVMTASDKPLGRSGLWPCTNVHGRISQSSGGEMTSWEMRHYLSISDLGHYAGSNELCICLE